MRDKFITVTRLPIGLGALATILLLSASFPAFAQDAKSGPKAKLDLISSVETVVPGKPFDLGLRFKIAEGWHIYWQNPGDAGLPPAVDWKLPEGFTVGALQFPVPMKHVSPGDIVTNIIEYEPVLLARVTPPATTGLKSAMFDADVVYLICKEQCLRETAKVHVEIPVGSPGVEPKPANADVFEGARAALPSTTSKYVTVKPSLDVNAFPPGQKFTVTLDVEIAAGHHIQAHDPGNEALIKCEALLERNPGMTFKKPEYPAGTKKNYPGVGNVAQYHGRIAIRVPGEVEDAQSGPPRIAGLLFFQACNEMGRCFPPEVLAFSTDAKAPSGPKTGDASGGDKPALADAAPSAPSTASPIGGPVILQDPRTARPVQDGAAQPAAAAQAPKDGLEGFLARLGLVGQLVACFLYGLAINATPCVLPLLSIKVLTFVKQAHDSRARTLALGGAFGVGVVLFFVVLGLLASAGTNILHFPVANIALGTIVMAMALAMLGVFDIQPPNAAMKLESHIRREGLFSSFGKGLLAPVLGFACTGPLLAGAFGWATKQPPKVAVLAFLAAGVGMASPYMLLGANPRWLGFLPKPGPWMVTFERIMGFLLLAMVIWLLNPLVGQIGTTGFQWTLVFLIAVAFACWLLGKIEFTMEPIVRWKYRGAATAVTLVAALLVFGWIHPLSQAQDVVMANADSNDWTKHVPWRKWSQESVAETVKAGRIVFVDFTAGYCTVCKVNKKVAIETAEAREKMKSLGVVPYQGDFSRGDKKIFQTLQQYDRAGVPLNLIYPAGRPDAPIVLDPNLTKEYLLAKLDEAVAQSRTVDAATKSTAQTSRAGT